METGAHDREPCIGGTPHRATRYARRRPGIGVRLGLIGVVVLVALHCVVSLARLVQTSWVALTIVGSAAILVLRQRPAAMHSHVGDMSESGNAARGVKTQSSRAKASLQLPVRTALCNSKMPGGLRRAGFTNGWV